MPKGSPDQLSPTTGEVTNAQGISIYFDPNDRRGLSLQAAQGAPYPNSLALWELALKLRDRWDVVLDIGSNYGEMLVDVELPDSDRVVAFEPNLQVLPFLKKTLTGINRIVEVSPLAVGDVPLDQVVLDIDLEWSGRSHLASVETTPLEGGFAQASISQTTLDEFFPNPPNDLCIKVDVEGYELNVLRGAAHLLLEAEIVVIMLEILHLSVQDVLDLSRTYPLYLLDIKEKKLVRYSGRDGYELGRALHRGDLYRQDAIILAGSRAEELDGLLRQQCDDTLSRENKIRIEQKAQIDELHKLRRTLTARTKIPDASRLAAARLQQFSQDLRKFPRQ